MLFPLHTKKSHQFWNGLMCFDENVHQNTNHCRLWIKGTDFHGWKRNFGRFSCCMEFSQRHKTHKFIRDDICLAWFREKEIFVFFPRLSEVQLKFWHFAKVSEEKNATRTKRKYSYNFSVLAVPLVQSFAFILWYKPYAD